LLDELISRSEKRRTCLIDGDRTISYVEIESQIHAFATLISEQIGVKQGDRVAIFLPNCWQFVASMFAVFMLGAIAVPIDFRSTQGELSFLMKDSGATLIVSDSSKKQILPAEVPALLVEAHPEKDLVPGAKEIDHTFKSKISSQSDIALIIYTGGTTGPPKGVMLSHRNLYAVLRGMSLAWDLKNGGETFVAVLPMSHSGGLNCNVNVMIFNSGRILIMKKFEPPKLLDMIEKYRVTGFAAVPTVYNALIREPDLEHRNLSSLRICLSSGAALSDNTVRLFREKSGILINQGWGLTEASPQLTLSPIGVYETSYVGKPLSGMEIATMDENHNVLTFGEVGELVARGDQIMGGYWHNEKETMKVLLSDGWLLTGDIGRVTEKGVYLLGRKKDVINSGGYKIWPGEIERVLMENEHVKEAAVIGVPDDYLGEAVKACIVMSTPITEEDLRIFCKIHLSSYKIPRYFEFLDSLPKTSVGKILSRNLSRK
jgi:long-chain acyl-CoA synthetase